MFKRKAIRGGMSINVQESANEDEEDMESSSGSELSSDDEGHEVKLNITMDDVIDSEESKLEFLKKD